MRTTFIIPALALLALAGCDDQKAAQAPKNSTNATEPKTASQVPTPGPATTATAPSKTATASGSLDAYKGRTFSAGPVSLRLNPDSTFRMDETDGNRKVEGQWQYIPSGNLLVLSDPKGDVGTTQFPIRCQFKESGSDVFQLGETAGSCTRFKDLTFKPTAG